MILVTGANGQLGSATIDFMLNKNTGANIAGLVRSQEKGKALQAKGVEVRIGDYADPESMKKSMEGVEVLLLISASSLHDRAQQHRNAIEAAKESGVGHIFYTSLTRADKKLSPLADSHHETEELITASGIPYTIYRNTYYLELFPMFLGSALQAGEWQFPSGGKKVNFALRSEMAEALANGLAAHDVHKNKTYELASPVAYTLQQYAQIVSEAIGRDITYTDVPLPAFEDQLKKAGLPDIILQITLITASTFMNGALDVTSNDLEYLLGRKPADVTEALRRLIGQA
jgi:NAD(P)H dehydrogenase (quinone)